VRLVLDTNVVVAGLLYAGPPNRLLDSAIAGKVLCFSSSTLLLELRRVLGYPKFARRISGLGTNTQLLVDRYVHLVEIVAPPAITGVVAGDPDDDHVIACAVAAKAGLIVSGDRDLLLLESFRGISIVSPANALRAIASA
jgi:putative PIN family toxin of toxin-antitoxin system